MSDDRDFVLRPNQNQKFRSNIGKSILDEVLHQHLHQQQYHPETAQQLSNKIAEDVRNKLKGLGLDHYKYIVQITIGEQRGQGISITAQCLWDADCDSSSHSFFSNKSLWCEAVVFALFHY